MPTEFQIEDIKRVISQIKDPAKGINIIDAGFISDVSLEGNQLNISVLSNMIAIEKRTVFNEILVQTIQVEYPELEINLHIINSNESEIKEKTLPDVKHIIAVASGKGGVGKSTVSVNLGLALVQQGYKVGILDADLYGPSIPTMLGIHKSRPKIVNTFAKPKMEPIQVHGMKAISIGMIVEPEQAVVLRGPRLAGILKQFIDDTLWGELDYLIVDLPPGTGDIQLTLVQSVPLSGAVIVTTPQEVAVADARRAINMFLMDQIRVPILGIVENMAWFTPDELPQNKYHLFGEGGALKLAKEAQTEVLGQIPLKMNIREQADLGNNTFNFKVENEFLEISKKLIDSLHRIETEIGKAKVVQMKN